MNQIYLNKPIYLFAVVCNIFKFVSVDALLGTYCIIPKLLDGNVKYLDGNDAANHVSVGWSIKYTCHHGFNLNLAEHTTVYCNYDGTWIPNTQPECSAVLCGDINTKHPMQNGTWQPVGVACSNYNCVHKLQCHEGYDSTTGPIIVVCQSSGLWSAPNGTCQASYCIIPKLLNGNVKYLDGNDAPNHVRLGWRIKYTCHPGFNLNLAEYTTVYCNNDGTWSPNTHPVCSAFSCGDINTKHPMQNGTWQPVGVDCSDYNCVYNLQCHEGYDSTTGPIMVVCQSSGLWSAPNGTCQAVSCGDINIKFPNRNGTWEPYHGKSSSCFSFNCGFILHCNEGYNSTVGHSMVVCEKTGFWSQPVGECHVVTCKIPNMDISISHKTSNPAIYQSHLESECNYGYKYKSGSFNQTCQANGEWSGTTLTCEVVTCKIPNLDISISHKTSNPAIYQSHLESECNYGYKYKSGSFNQTCQANGDWSETTLICEEEECIGPKSIQDGKYYVKNSSEVADTKTFNVSTTLVVKCNDGYVLAEESPTSTHCLGNGSWSWWEPTCKVILSAEGASSQAAVIGGAVGVVVSVIIIVLVIVGILFIRRRGRKANNYTRPRPPGDQTNKDGGRAYSNIEVAYQNKSPLETVDTSVYSCINDAQMAAEENIVLECEDESRSVVSTSKSVDTDISIEENHEDYYNITSFDKKSPTAILLDNLLEFVLTEKTKNTKLEEQFNKLNVGLMKNHDAARKPINARKNRYKQIYAYDENRVILKRTADKRMSDYINSSYVHGYDQARAYIASQGPTKDMVDDFWTMVWQQDCGKIVMLTNLKEENKMKCIQYWPNKGSQTFGNVTVTLKDVETYSDFTIRTLAITQASDKQRIVRQFHYTAWPDRGVPAFASSIVNFRNKVLKAQSYCKGPTVVHCSAGIGRTGTYIALDILTDQGNSLGYIDVAACVAALRQQRVNMVQNLDQYIFLHSALTEALMLSSSAISAPAFSDMYQELLQIDPVKRRRNIEIKFDMLKHMSPVADEQQYVSAREVRNKKRNRYSNILPVSEFMPTIKGSTHDGYINAVYLPSYKEKKAMILTQMPLANTKDDFWALIQQQEVHTIVMLNNVIEAEKEEVYWPDVGESQTYNNHDVESLGEENVGQHSVVTLNLSDENTERTVKQIQCRYWPAHQSLPGSPSDIIETIELVQKLQQQSGNHPVVVHCMNGVDRSGLFCVISAVIERLKIEQDVAITQIIEQMRCCRDQIIPSCEQFQFCHDVVLTYIQQFTEYSNFSSL